jgi:integral membrane sensor domain MASE1
MIFFKKVGAYIIVWACAMAAFYGIAVLFEESLVLKASGAFVVIISIVIGNVIAKKYWPESKTKK